ncbi:MAG: DNA polymerase I [Desulfobulbaceae bacterium A2]|nr:MAG: DNA polymerase I [Desulfobulbaceae bacterium A2]
MTPPDTVYLIDASAYIHRAFHAIAPLQTSTGLPTNAVFGFIKIIQRLLKERQPRYLAVALDTRGPVFRHRLYTDYKANRPPMAPELAAQIPLLRELLEAERFLLLEHDDLEADDLIASAARRLEELGCRVVIISGDKDLHQLITARVSVWDPMNDRELDEAGVQTLYGLAPGQLRDYLALTGDSADNVPGVAGIGPKTAQKLLQDHGTLSALYQALPTMKPGKTTERLAAHRAEALLSQELISLRLDGPVPARLEDYARQEADSERLDQLYRRLEFSSLLQSREAPLIDHAGFQLVRSPAELTDLQQALAGAQLLVLDTETTGLDPLQDRVVGLSLCCDAERAWYLPWGHCDPDGAPLPGQLSRAEILAALGPRLEDPALPKLGHNLKFDYAMLAAPHNGGIRLAGPLYDTMIGAYLLDPARRSYKLDDLSREQGFRLTSYAEATAGLPNFAHVALTEACAYSCEDVRAALLLFAAMRPRLETDGLWPLFAEVECPLLAVLAAMENRGILVRRELLETLSREFGEKLLVLEGAIHRLAGQAFNINSPKQLGEILFDVLHLPHGRKTKTGYSTDNRVLEQLARSHELPRAVMEYRNLAKLKSTHIDALMELIRPDSGRVHTSFNQCATATGRLSSSQPNLQNIPIRGEEGRRIRAAFIAPPGQVLVAADYSQIDLRVLAHYSADPALLKAFHANEDIHTRTAAEIFAVNPLMVSPEMRRAAKSINFGIVYGMSGFGLAQQLDISRQKAQDFIDRYFAHYAGVRRFMDEIVIQARRDGAVSTLLGRRRPLPDLASSNRTVREFAERTAINTPIQGTAADIIKLAMLRVEEALRREGFKARLLLQIHDELVLEAPEDKAKALTGLLKREMEGVVTLAVPLLVHVSSGPDLGKG